MTRYWACMRWSLAQLGFGATHIEAVTELEGTYSAVVGFVSLVTSASVISSMTSLVSALNGRRSEETKQLSLLRRFLKQNGITDEECNNLRQRITRFLQYTYHQKSRFAHEQPVILDLLSKPLHAELQFHRYKSCLLKIPFLDQICSNLDLSFTEGHVMQKIATEAIMVFDAAEDDLVFVADRLAETCFFPIQGQLRYLQMERNAVSVGTDLLIAEMCLWTPWSFVGDLQSCGFSKLVSILADEFCKCIVPVQDLQKQAHSYALDYLEKLNAEAVLSDLWQLPKSPDSSSESDNGVRDRRARSGTIPLHGLSGCLQFFSTGKSRKSTKKVSPSQR